MRNGNIVTRRSILWNQYTGLLVLGLMVFVLERISNNLDPSTGGGRALRTTYEFEQQLEDSVTQPKSVISVARDTFTTSTTDATTQKYAIYLTTHMSEEHEKFLTNCWPAAVQRLPLLQTADFVIYTSMEQADPRNQLFYGKLSTADNQILIHRYEETGDNSRVQKQTGATRAMVDPFETNSTTSWFEGYDWVLRMNPDVLIRRDEWLLQTMQNPQVDAIAVDWRRNFRNKSPKALHSDFFAFRPEAINGTALQRMYEAQMKSGKLDAESHIYAGVEHLIEQERVAWLPNVKGNWRFARTDGPYCDIVHHHAILQACPNYFDAAA